MQLRTVETVDDDKLFLTPELYTAMDNLFRSVRLSYKTGDEVIYARNGHNYPGTIKRDGQLYTVTTENGDSFRNCKNKDLKLQQQMSDLKLIFHRQYVLDERVGKLYTVVNKRYYGYSCFQIASYQGYYTYKFSPTATSLQPNPEIFAHLLSINSRGTKLPYRALLPLIRAEDFDSHARHLVVRIADIFLQECKRICPLKLLWTRQHITSSRPVGRIRFQDQVRRWHGRPMPVECTVNKRTKNSNLNIFVLNALNRLIVVLSGMSRNLAAANDDLGNRIRDLQQKLRRFLASEFIGVKSAKLNQKQLAKQFEILKRFENQLCCKHAIKTEQVGPI